MQDGDEEDAFTDLDLTGSEGEAEAANQGKRAGDKASKRMKRGDEQRLLKAPVAKKNEKK